MTYKELQTTLKEMKNQGLTGIALNATKEVLQAEYERLTTKSSESLESLENKREELVKEYNNLANSANYTKDNTALDILWELRKKVDDKIKELDKKIETLQEIAKNDKTQSKNKTQIVKLTNTSAEVKVNGKTKTIKIKSANNVEDVIGYLNNDNDIKYVFKYYLAMFSNNKFLLKRYNVYFPNKQQLEQRQQDKATRERYYQSYKFQAELSKNEREVKKYISTLRK